MGAFPSSLSASLNSNTGTHKKKTDLMGVGEPLLLQCQFSYNIFLVLQSLESKYRSQTRGNELIVDPRVFMAQANFAVKNQAIRIGANWHRINKTQRLA